MIQTIAGTFSSLEEFSGMARQTGFGLDFRQLKPADKNHRIAAMGTQCTRLARIDLGACVEQHADIPLGHRAFGILLDEGCQGQIAGRPLRHDSLMCFHEERGIHAVSKHVFTGFTLSFDVNRLSEIADHLGLPDPDCRAEMSDSDVLPNPVRLGQLRTLIQTVLSTMTPAGIATMDSPGIHTVLESEIPAAILQTLVSSSPIVTASARQRTKALHKALEYIEAAPQEARSVEDLCRVAGASISSLERAFREHFGISPKRYLRMARLNRVQKELLDRDSDRNISDIAMDWGFWHMGKFAADYRGLFGQLPSQARQG